MWRACVIAYGTSYPCSGRIYWRLQISHHAEVITRPDSIDWSVENSLAVSDGHCRSVSAASDHEVVDPWAEFERHLSGAYQRVVRREGLTRFARMRRIQASTYATPIIAISSGTGPARLPDRRRGRYRQGDALDQSFLTKSQPDLH